MKKRLIDLIKKLISIKGLLLLVSTIIFILDESKIPLGAWMGIVGYVIADRTVEKKILYSKKTEKDTSSISLGR